MESGDADHRDIAITPIDPVEVRVAQCVADCSEAAMSEHDAFREASGTAGVELRDRRIRMRLERRGVGSGVSPGGEAREVCDDLGAAG